MTTVDLITQEVIRARLDGIVREMEAAVFRTGFSTIVRESHDFSCGLLDRDGRVVGQSNHPSHMGAYPYCVGGLLQFYSYDDMREGDAFLANHPYYSGTPHANDSSTTFGVPSCRDVSTVRSQTLYICTMSLRLPTNRQCSRKPVSSISLEITR